MIHAPDGKAYPIYVEVFSNAQLGQFYDVQGTTWIDAPLFASPNQTLRVGQRNYELYYDGTDLQMVAWHEYGARYWVHNTLTNAVDSGELLAIAEQTTPIASVSEPAAPGHAGASRAPSLRDAVAPVRVAAPVKLTTTQIVGSIGGVIALLVLPLLTVGFVRRRRQLRRLRAELLELENRRVRLLAAAEATRGPRMPRARRSPLAAPAGPAPPPAPASHVAVRAGSDSP